MSDDEGPDPTPAQRVGRWSSEAARAAGYDIDSPRGSGRIALAEATGMSTSAVGRMLSGETMPSPRRWESIARALRRPLAEILIETGTATREFLEDNAQERKPTGPLQPTEAAALLGITIPANVSLFVSMVENLQQQESEEEPRSTPGAV